MNKIKKARERAENRVNKKMTKNKINKAKNIENKPQREQWTKYAR